MAIWALVTGASEGLGREFATLAADGAEKKTLITRLPMPAAQSVAEAGWAAMVKRRRVKVVGISNKLFAFFPRLAPRRLVTFSAGIFLKRRW